MAECFFMLPTRYVSCSRAANGSYTSSKRAGLRDSTEKSCEILENAQSIANFHKTRAMVESRIFLAFRLADSALNISQKGRIFFTCGSLQISPRRQVVRPSRSVLLHQRQALPRQWKQPPVLR